MRSVAAALTRVIHAIGERRRQIVWATSATAAASAVLVSLLILVAASPQPELDQPWADPKAPGWIDFGHLSNEARDGVRWRVAGWSGSQLLLVCTRHVTFEGETDAYLVDARSRDVMRWTLVQWSDALPSEEEGARRAAQFARNRFQLDRWAKSHAPLHPSTCGMAGPGGHSMNIDGEGESGAEVYWASSASFDIRDASGNVARGSVATPRSLARYPEGRLQLVPCWSADGENVVFIARATEEGSGLTCGANAILLR